MWDTLIINPMVNTLLFIYSILWHNFGLSIIIFTLLIRLLTHPLTIQQLKGASAMQELQKNPKWQEAQKKYKGDREKLSQEQMKLYKELGINPFGSCLPTLIQFPIIIGLYQAIIRALAVTPTQLLDLSKHIYPFFERASFLIPLNNRFLWMDLSQPERLNIFGVGIPTLAIIVVITTYMQSKLMTPVSQPGEQGAQMTQAMNLYMPFLMGYLALTFASGLSIYFIASNLFTIGQYAAMGKLNWSNLLPGRRTPAVQTGTGEKKQLPAKSESPAQKPSTNGTKKQMVGKKKTAGRRLTSGKK
jgi:YidC/Oxa1 family membrane protein insertase